MYSSSPHGKVNEARCSGVGIRNEGDEGPGINADLAEMKDTECHPLEVDSYDQ